MGIIFAERIGHFVADTSIFNARQSLRSRDERVVDIFWFPELSCNGQWARMVKRQLFVRWWVKYLAVFNRLIPGGRYHDLASPSESGNRAEYNSLRQTTARFSFLPEEEDAAKRWLKKRNWRDGEPFVCLAVRDSAYLSSRTIYSNGPSDRWNYHSYRDSNIDAYVEAVQALVERGYWVIRMGKAVHKRLPFKHKRVIDYPFVDDQDDLMDVWLSVNCHFFISTATGIDTIPWVYQKAPIVFVNALPLFLCGTPINNIWVPKHLTWKATGNALTLKEHCCHCYTHSEEYREAGIEITDLSSAEVAAAVMECEQRLAGRWVESREDSDRQRRFWDEFRKSESFPLFHDYIHPEARMGSAWLRSMGDAFLA